MELYTKPGTRDGISPANIRPEDFIYIESYYCGSVDELYDANPKPEFFEQTVRDALIPETIYGRLPSRCQCCGHVFAYGTVYQHKPTGKYVFIGHQCASNTLTYPDKATLDLDRLKRQVTAGRERNKIRKQVQAIFDANAGLEQLIEANKTHHIIADISARLWRYGNISDKQIELVRKIDQQVKNDAIRKQQRQQKLESGATVWVEGRRQVTGKIISIKVVDNDFAYSGTIQKCLVELEDGARCYGTLPSSLDNCQKGDIIEFTATIQPSKDDKFFAFYSRPSKARVVDITPVQETV